MSSRREPPNSLDLFPTPPWATRALLEHVLEKEAIKDHCAWDPFAGLDHMADVLEEYFAAVIRSDVFDYGRGHLIGSFVGAGPDVVPPQPRAHWVVGNPPFNLALACVQRALALDLAGVALLLRSNWAEGSDRYRDLFSKTPPNLIAQFSERVPMTKGRWDPDASTMTSYSWFIWFGVARGWRQTQFIWIPPDCRSTLTRADDHTRFATRGVIEVAPAPLLGGAA
jgi:hypothetical protein